MRGCFLIIALILAVPAAAAGGDDNARTPAYRPPPAPAAAAAQAGDAGVRNDAFGIGRITLLTGEAWWFVESMAPGDWARAEPDLPVVSRSSLSTLPGARAEVLFGSTAVWLDGDSQADFERVAGDQLILRVARGSVAISLASFAQEDAIEIGAGDARLLPRAAGVYALGNDPATGKVLARVYQGQADLRAGVLDLALIGGEQAGIDAAGYQIHERGSVGRDGFAQWVAERDDLWKAAATLQAAGTGNPVETAVPVIPVDTIGAGVPASPGQWGHDPVRGTIWYPAAVIYAPVTAPFPPTHRNRRPGPDAEQPRHPHHPRHPRHPQPPRIDVRPVAPYPDPPRAFPNPPRSYATPPRAWPSPGMPIAHPPQVPFPGIAPTPPRRVTKP